MEQLASTKFNENENDETLRTFGKLQHLDDEMCKYGSTLAMNIFKDSRGLRAQKEANHNINLAGSLSEGTTIARVFQGNTLFPDGLNHETEIDIEYTLFEIPDIKKHIVCDIPNKVGYVNVKVDFEILKETNSLGWKVSDEDLKESISKITTEDGFLQSFKLKSETLSKVKYKNTNKAIELIIAAALNKKCDDVSINIISQDVTKASVGSEFLLNIERTPYLKFSFDAVTIIRLLWWPNIVEEFKQRQRNWPNQQVVDKISSISYLIAKPSVEEKLNMETIELRYSFAHVERDLVSMRTPHQKMIYLILKIVLYKWIKPLDCDRITSFIGKTVMFWACEQYPPEHKIWNVDYLSTINAFSYLFKQMLQAFQSGNLPYYFNKNVNVIEAIPFETREKVIERIISIVADVENYLPISIGLELKACNEILDSIKSIIKVMDEIKRNDYSRLLKQPELISDVLLYYIDEIDFDQLKQKVKREGKRIGNQIEKEAGRFEKKIEKEAGRVGKQIENEAGRVGKKLEKKAKKWFK